MSQTAKVQEPSMEEILASIRRIIADEDTAKTGKPAESAAPKPSSPAADPPSSPPEPPPAAANGQNDIDAMLADLEEPQPPAPTVEPEPAAAPADVLDLSEENVAPTPEPEQAASFLTIDGDSDVVFADRESEALQRPVEAAPQPIVNDRTLISNATAQAVDSAFNALAHTVLGQNARTLEDLVKEMLRPMLKSWLDDNLPSLVERIVRAEIERVSRGKP
jgi:uncharacterized protein